MPKKRASFRFPQGAAAKLNFIQRRSRLDNPTDVIRAALTAYDELLGVTIEGCEIFVRDKEGREWPYSPYMPFTYPGFDGAQEEVTKPTSTPQVFFFSGEALDRLESIKVRSFVTNNADAIRAALSAYNELVGVTAAHDTIIIREPGGSERVFLPHAPLLRPQQLFQEKATEQPHI